MKNTLLRQPNYTITPATASELREIEATRVVQAKLRRLDRGRERCLRSFSGLTASPPPT